MPNCIPSYVLAAPIPLIGDMVVVVVRCIYFALVCMDVVGIARRGCGAVSSLYASTPKAHKARQAGQLGESVLR